MEIWGKFYLKFTTPQLCPFQELFQLFVSIMITLNKIYKTRRGFTSCPKIIGPIFVHKDQFIQIFLL
jgi:hypothetical protein